MKPQIGLDQCLSFINCQLQASTHPRSVAHGGMARRVVTISRLSGSGGHVVAAKLAELLHAQAVNGAPAWTVFDRNLVEKVLEDHHLPQRLAQFMPEDRITGIADTMYELFGQQPRSETLVHKSAETILHLAELGHVILIGRGATVIVGPREDAFHVRLIGSFEKRVEYIAQLEHLSLKAAGAFVRREDRGRKRYVKRYFGKDIDDPLLYHAVINTDLLPYEEAAWLIAKAVVGKR